MQNATHKYWRTRALMLFARVCYVIGAAFAGAAAVDDLRAHDWSGALLFVLVAIFALYRLYKNISAWQKIRNSYGLK